MTTKQPELPELTSRTDADGQVWLVGENDQVRVTLPVRPAIWSDPRGRHLLVKLFALDVDDATTDPKEQPDDR